MQQDYDVFSFVYIFSARYLDEDDCRSMLYKMFLTHILYKFFDSDINISNQKKYGQYVCMLLKNKKLFFLIRVFLFFSESS